MPTKKPPERRQDIKEESCLGPACMTHQPSLIESERKSTAACLEKFDLSGLDPERWRPIHCETVASYVCRGCPPYIRRLQCAHEDQPYTSHPANGTEIRLCLAGEAIARFDADPWAVSLLEARRYGQMEKRARGPRRDTERNGYSIEWDSSGELHRTWIYLKRPLRKKLRFGLMKCFQRLHQFLHI